MNGFVSNLAFCFGYDVRFSTCSECCCALSGSICCCLCCIRACKNQRNIAREIVKRADDPSIVLLGPSSNVARTLIGKSFAGTSGSDPEWLMHWLIGKENNLSDFNNPKRILTSAFFMSFALEMIGSQGMMIGSLQEGKLAGIFVMKRCYKGYHGPSSFDNCSVGHVICRSVCTGKLPAEMKDGSPEKKKVETRLKALDAAFLHFHKNNMGNDHMYINTVAIDPNHQGQKHCSKLMRAVLVQTDTDNIPCYLECTGEKNKAMYEHFGFELVEQAQLNHDGTCTFDGTNKALASTEDFHDSPITCYAMYIVSSIFLKSKKITTMTAPFFHLKSQMVWSRAQKRNVGPLEAIVLGGAAHALVFTIAAPLNRVQVLLRVEPELRTPIDGEIETSESETKRPRVVSTYGSDFPETFSGTLDCCRKIYARDGFRGFFFGNLVAVMRWIPIQIVDWFAESWLGTMLRPADDAPFFAKAFGNIFRHRAIRAAVALFSFPFDVLWARIRCEGFRPSVEAGSGSFGGFYDGLWMHTLGNLAYQEIKFTLLHQVLRLEASNGHGNSGDGGSGGAIIRHLVMALARFARYPFHTVCYRQWVAKRGKYRSSWHAMKCIVSREGIFALWRGVHLDIARGLLADLTLFPFRAGSRDVGEFGIGGGGDSKRRHSKGKPKLMHRASTTFAIRRQNSESVALKR
eukprot:g4521.t1